MMKKLIFIFLLLLPFLGLGQGYYPEPSKIQTLNITNNVIQNGWAITGSTCAGCASVFYKILRSSLTHQAEDGRFYYYYYFIFYSNSYYSNGNPGATYLTNAKFYEDGAMRVQSNYILIEINNQKFVAWVRTTNAYASVTFHVDQMTVY
jgi:hypothetical protein